MVSNQMLTLDDITLFGSKTVRNIFSLVLTRICPSRKYVGLLSVIRAMFQNLETSCPRVTLENWSMHLSLEGWTIVTLLSCCSKSLQLIQNATRVLTGPNRNECRFKVLLRWFHITQFKYNFFEMFFPNFFLTS